MRLGLSDIYRPAANAADPISRPQADDLKHDDENNDDDDDDDDVDYQDDDDDDDDDD